jgi:hypothetical protein
MVDMDDIYGEHRSYEGYELTTEEKHSLAQITIAADKKYTDEDVLRGHIDYLERLTQRLREILANEQAISYRNDTLEHDFKKIQRLLARLNSELDRLDQ